MNPNPTARVATVSLAPLLTTLVVGESQQLMATLRDDAGNVLSGHTIAWTTSDSGIASVASGFVTAVGVGTTTVTATSERKSAVASVSVGSGTGGILFSSVSAGGAHTCALTSNGTAYCWGRDESGQLGSPPATLCAFESGPLACNLAPAAVQGGVTFAQLTGGGAHNCGLSADGTAYCWGNNQYGQLGDNTTESRATPTAVATALKFTSIDAGGNHTCALTASGAAHCWGRNARGSIGDGSIMNRSAPVPVDGSFAFQQIRAGGFETGSGTGFTCGLVSTGDLYCWGDNERGQLGNGVADLNVHSLPTKVSGSIVFCRADERPRSDQLRTVRYRCLVVLGRKLIRSAGRWNVRG